MNTRARTSTPFRAVRIIHELFSSFHNANIPYCHWKSNEHLSRSLIGLTDLDVLVDRQYNKTLYEILTQTGFKLFDAVPMRRYIGVDDYLAFDEDTGRLVHLHLHYQLVLGEMFLKSYRLPWEALLLTSRTWDPVHNTYVADPNVEMLLLIVRAALKLRLRDVLRQQPSMSFRAEHSWLQERVEPQHVLRLAEELLGPEVVEPLRALITQRPSLHLIAAFRRSAAPLLRPYRTYNRLAAWLRANLRECSSALGALNRKIFHIAVPTRRTSTSGGLMIAILGSDGAGKSAVTREIARWLSWKVDVLAIYFGSGDGRSSFLRSPLKLGLQYFRRIARLRLTSQVDLAIEGHKLRASVHPWLRALAIVLWALALSYEKRSKLRTVTKARNRGMIVICDRLPQNQVSAVNDGPLLSHWLAKQPRLLRAIARWEAVPYANSRVYPPDLIVKLLVTPEIALKRKPEMSIVEIQRRVDIVKKLQFPETAKVVEINADDQFEKVVLNLKCAIWQLV